jgi:hypothetical protein
MSENRMNTGESDVPINHGHRAVLIPLANIARAQPAVLGKDGLIIVEVISLIVTTNNGWAAEEDLTLWRVIGREISGFGHVEELNFYGRARKAHGIILQNVGWQNAAHAARLGHTITFVYNLSSAPKKTKKRRTLDERDQSEV